MRLYRSILVILMIRAITGGHRQNRIKKDVYIYFKEDKNTGIYKEHRGAGTAKEFDIYWYIKKNQMGELLNLRMCQSTKILVCLRVLNL